MSVLGIILLFSSLGFFMYVYKVEKERDRLKYILPLITAFGILGFALIFQERIIEFPIPGVGPIKTVAQQTLDDAKLVKEIRDTVLAQSKTIGLVVQQANEM
jgi:Serpentine type 7TM GPCR chemoreceptor Srz